MILAVAATTVALSIIGGVAAVLAVIAATQAIFAMQMPQHHRELPFDEWVDLFRQTTHTQALDMEDVQATPTKEGKE